MSDTTAKILVLVESLDVDDSSGTKGRVALIHSLVNSGYEVTALHYSQKQIALEGVECISVKERKGGYLFFFSRVQRLLYRWFKIDIGKQVDSWFGFSFGFFNDARSMAKAVAKLKPEDYKMIWTLSKGNSYRPHKALLSLPQWHAKWYAYVHDPYPQQLYPRPYNYIPYGYKQKRMFFRQVSLNAKRVVFPSLLLKEWLQSYYTALKGKSLIIPHQISEQPNSLKKLPSYFNSEKFNVLHAGNLLDLRDPVSIVEAYRIFLKTHPEAKEDSALLFLGKKSAFSSYLQQSALEIPTLYSSADYVDFEAVYAMQMSASVNVILEAKSEISPFLPGKFAHCVAANHPILLIGPYYSESKRLLGDDYSYCFDFDAVNKIAAGLGELYLRWKQNNKVLKLERADLMNYLSASHLKMTIEEDIVV
jgi:glycosyltransferase involved in cell wall biosynthesis